MKRFQVCYHGESEWQDVDEKRVRRVLASDYIDVELCMEDLDNGFPVRTRCAFYRQVKKEKSE